MAPNATRSGRAGLYSGLGAAAALGGALVYTGIADPHRAGFLFPACPFKLLTGLNCPGCGGLRMTHDVLNGDIAAAAVDNVFLLIGLPALAIWLLVRWRLGRKLMPKTAAVVIGVSLVAWTIVRNLPGFPLVPTLLDG